MTIYIIGVAITYAFIVVFCGHRYFLLQQRLEKARMQLDIDYLDFLHWLDAEKGALRTGFKINKLVSDYLNE